MVNSSLFKMTLIKMFHQALGRTEVNKNIYIVKLIKMKRI